MTTDDEKRRVAKKLREYASWDGEEDCLVDCADWGERVLNLLDCGDTEGECYAALADLIDPDIYPDNPDKTRQGLSEPCDRDALLALADEMDVDAGCHAYVEDYVVYDYARRIRKALGVEQ